MDWILYIAFIVFGFIIFVLWKIDFGLGIIILIGACLGVQWLCTIIKDKIEEIQQHSRVNKEIHIYLKRIKQLSQKLDLIVEYEKNKERITSFLKENLNILIQRKEAYFSGVYYTHPNTEETKQIYAVVFYYLLDCETELKKLNSYTQENIDSIQSKFIEVDLSENPPQNKEELYQLMISSITINAVVTK